MANAPFSYNVIPAKAGIQLAPVWHRGRDFIRWAMKNDPSYVYILASKRNGTLYIGVTSDLLKRVYEHKKDLVKGFTKKYKVHDLVHYEIFGDIESAILREKQLKKWNRAWKVRLIEEDNPRWKDFYADLL